MSDDDRCILVPTAKQRIDELIAENTRLREALAKNPRVQHEMMELLVREKRSLELSLGTVVRELLTLTSRWRAEYPDDESRSAVAYSCGDDVEKIGIVRAQRMASADERIEKQSMAWEIELQTLSTVHPQYACLVKAMSSVKDAVREMDGSEHPAVWHIAQACRWLVAATEGNGERQRLR